jgi:hypothetical protein
LGTQARLFTFKFLAARIFISKRKSISPVDSVIASNIQEIVESAKLKRSKEVLTVMNTVTVMSDLFPVG